MFFDFLRPKMVAKAEALTGRDAPAFAVPTTHEMLGTPIQGPFPAGIETAIFGMGCFWGAERIFWQTPGVYSTASGYAGGFTPHPTYKEVSSGQTGHAEVVLVAFDPAKISYESLLKRFWEAHDPTQGMRQGNDVGTAGHGQITTEIAPAGPFFYAEDYHQQYLDKNPGGYCGIGGTGVSCPIGLGVAKS